MHESEVGCLLKGLVSTKNINININKRVDVNKREFQIRSHIVAHDHSIDRHQSFETKHHSNRLEQVMQMQGWYYALLLLATRKKTGRRPNTGKPSRSGLERNIKLYKHIAFLSGNADLKEKKSDRASAMRRLRRNKLELSKKFMTSYRRE
jgi:hypothetical protein